MRLAAGLGAIAILAALTGCETTGDPTRGGLFGWSESKARARQEEKRADVEGAEAQLARENASGAALQSRHTATSRELSEARDRRAREEKALRAQRDALVAKTEKLETDSPTDAAASRARALKLQVTTIAAQTWQTPQERSGSLRDLEGEIDKALGRLKQPKAR